MTVKELPQEPLEIGLTGGIGSGKSTVSAGLKDRGAVVIDADVIVRELQEPGKPVIHFNLSVYFGRYSLKNSSS